MKNILLVGGAGYLLGAFSDLVKTDKEKGICVRVYDSLIYESDYLKPGIQFVRGDIRNRDLLKKHLDWADVVVWGACHTGDGCCTVDPAISLEVNRESVKFLAENTTARVVFFSSCSVYGSQDGILTEESPVNPLSLYAISKYQSEAYLKDKNAIIFRLGTLFGLGDTYSRIRVDLVVNTLVARAWSTGVIKVFGGDQFRPLLHVKDVAEAIFSAIYSSETGIFNLHYQNVRIIDVAHQVRAHFPDIKMEITDLPFEDLRNYKVSSDKARKLLDFNPTRTLDSGILEFKKLLEEGRIKNINDPRYHNHNFFKEKRPYLDFPADPKLEEEVKNMNLSSVL
jgi:nucleoside-diphosphate-sugar epimerase